jgi:MMPL family
VTSAGLVFAFTMLAMPSSDLRTIGRVGSTVCIGRLLDTLIVRSFVVPASSASSGRGSGGQHWYVPIRYRSGRSAIRFRLETPMPEGTLGSAVLPRLAPDCGLVADQPGTQAYSHGSSFRCKWVQPMPGQSAPLAARASVR